MNYIKEIEQLKAELSAFKKTNKVDWKKRYYNLRSKYNRLKDTNSELGKYKNAVLFYNGRMD